MSETTRKAGTNSSSVPADVTAAMAELHDVLDGLAGLNIPILTGIAKDAKRAATVCTDALLDMASEMAVSA